LPGNFDDDAVTVTIGAKDGRKKQPARPSMAFEDGQVVVIDFSSFFAEDVAFEAALARLQVEVPTLVFEYDGSAEQAGEVKELTRGLRPEEVKPKTEEEEAALARKVAQKAAGRPARAPAECDEDNVGLVPVSAKLFKHLMM